MLLAAAPAAAEEVGDAVRGETLWRACSSCHRLGEGARHAVGPSLNRVFGRNAGTIDGFRFSKAMREAGEGGLIWTFETLDPFLEKPKSVLPGTKMSYRGMDNAADRFDLLAYLREFSDKPSNIPEAVPTARKTPPGFDPALWEIEGDPEYGEYLSSECSTCHQRDGADEGIPSITGWPEEDFVVALHAYKVKERDHPVMQMMAGRLSDEEIAALAAYYATLMD